MDRKDIAGVLEEIARLLELLGENTFKVRAYQNGARVLGALEEDLAMLIDEERLDQVPGIGAALAEKISTLHHTGNLPYHERLRASVAPGLLEMLEIPGFGPKKIRKVHATLGISTIAELAAACADGRIAALPGFGAKSQENLLRGIRNREAYGRRHLWWDAAAAAEPILAGLRALPAVIRAEAAGSLRRGRETVGDLDFIVASADPAPVMQWFVGQPDIAEVSAHGETKSSIRLADGLQADLRVVPDDRFVFALHHFTGSKDHNVLMRQRALARGLSLSEWGLFSKDSARDESVPSWERPLAVSGIREEADLFAALGLQPIPPDLREGLDEIERAEAGPLPRLIEDADLRGTLHCHTTASDGRDSLAAMAAAAAAHGLEYLGIADHSKASFQAHGLDADRLLQQAAAIRQLNAGGRCPLHLLAGCEVDILRDGSLDFDRAVLDQLDYVVLSVHAPLTGQSEAEMTERVCRALATPLGVRKILGHATGRLLLRREGYAIDLSTVIRAAAAADAWIELNAHPQRLDLDWRFWRQATEAGVPCVINPDAHETAGFAHLRAGVRAARKGWLEPRHVRNTLPLADFLRALKPSH